MIVYRESLLLHQKSNSTPKNTQNKNGAHNDLTMRFKAKLTPEQLTALYQCVVPLSKIASSSSIESSSSWMKNSGIVALDSTVLRISCKGKTMDVDGISCFAELKAQGGIFSEHRIESAAANNQIVMEMDLHQLKSALQSILPSEKSSSSFDFSTQSQPQQITVIKLAKRNNTPCLCIEALSGVQIHHAVPCRVCPAEDLALYLPPRLPAPQVQLELPTHLQLKSIVDRLVHMSPQVQVQGHNLKGEMVLHVETDGASSKTLLQGLKGRPEDCQEGSNNEAICKVDTKKFNSCLPTGAKAVFSSHLLCLIENEALVLHCSSPHLGFCTYYVPVHFMDPEELENNE